MKNRLLLLIFTALLATTSLTAQVCGTYYGSYEEQEQKYPAFYQSLDALNANLKANYKSVVSKMKNLKTENGKKIIPVVVHVIHNGGTENLSLPQIQNGIDHLNANINGQSYNFLDGTPDIFALLRGDLNVEFRLAKLNPNGMPTNGVVRVRSDLTNATVTATLSRDRVKALSYWNSYQYLNIWVVKAMPGNDAIEEPALNGYAQFPEPNFDRMSTDGVMIRAAVFKNGETITHEVGHWLGLCHTWACGAGSCGTDNVADTPIDREGTFDFNGTFPFHAGITNPSTGLVPWGCVADSLNPAGEMYMNYMDYQADAVQTMFTKGQNVVMNGFLEGIYDEETGVSSFGYRQYMCSDENNIATGTNEGYFNLNDSCRTKYDFGVTSDWFSVCLGTEVWFKSNSKILDLDVTSAVWDLGDSNSEVLSDSLWLPIHGFTKKHEYEMPGSYSVKLMVEYNDIREVRVTDLDNLLEGYDALDEIDTNLIVQGTQDELIAMGASDITVHIDDDGYSLNSFWRRNLSSTDSILDASSIDTLQFDSIVSVLIYVDSTYLSVNDLAMLSSADTSWNDHVVQGYLDTIIDYNFLYNDTTVLNILTFIDSTYLSATDSAWLANADSSWSIEGILASDSIIVYFGQINNDSVITLSVNIDSSSLSSQDSLMFNTSDSSWSSQSIIGNIDTLRTYYGQFNYYYYDGYYADTLFYRGKLERTTYVAYYNSSCKDTIEKINYITIGEESPTNPSSLPITYSFESENDLSDVWVSDQPQIISNEWDFHSPINTVWEWTSKASNLGNASIMIKSGNLEIGVSSEIISPSYDLSGLTNPAIKFSWSGASSSVSPVNELKVSYSLNCGRINTWSNLGTIDEIKSANAGIYVSNFIPNASQWMDTVLTKANLINDNVMFKFEYIINGSSNNFYLDNIMIGEELDLMIVENISPARVLIYPNPSAGNAFIELNNLADKLVEVKLVNILGAEVKHLFSGELVSNYYMINNIDLSDLETGIYFVKVVADGDLIMTDKLILK